MSIEDTLAKLTTAVEALTAAITASGVAASTPQAKAAPKETPEREVLWASTDGTYGKCSYAEYKTMSKAEPDVYSVIDPEEFKRRTDEAKAKMQANKEAAKPKPEAKAKAPAKSKAAPTEEDLLVKAKGFLDGAENEEDSSARKLWLKDELLPKFGVARVREVAEAQRQEFIEALANYETSANSEEDLM